MSHPLEAWREFARHADGCRECEVGAALVRRCPEAHKSAWGVCCDAGRALLEVWIAAVQELAIEMRAKAPRDAQEGMVAAVVAAHRAGGTVARERDPERRTCANEDCTQGVNGTRAVFDVMPRHRDQRWCSDRCRKACSRPRLIVTEE